MASPLREQPAWLAPDREAEETKAPEAGVAGAKDGAAKPGEMLVLVKGDLTDHQRWLESQFAAIQADRERHERWLESQRKYRTEVATHDRARRRRQLARRRALHAIAKPFVATAVRLRSRFGLLVAKIAGDLTAMTRRIGNGAAAIGAKLRDAAFPLVKMGSAKSLTLMRSSGAGMSGALDWSKTKAETWTPALQAWMTTARHHAARYAGAASASAAKLFAKAKGLKAERPGASGVTADTAPQTIIRAGAGNGLSLAARMREASLGQMPIIAGAVVLVCGALMLGSGLLLREGAPLEPDTPDPIAWSFEAPSQSPSHRVVFTLSGTPANFRINGLLFRGENSLDRALTGVEGVVKADRPRPELGLTLRLAGPEAPAGEPHAVEIPLAPAAQGDTIPPRVPFELVFAFPGEGLSPEEFFDAYGGLTLNVRYAVEDKQRVLIQYLSPEMLKAQLADIQAMGS